MAASLISPQQFQIATVEWVRIIFSFCNYSMRLSWMNICLFHCTVTVTAQFGLSCSQLYVHVFLCTVSVWCAARKGFLASLQRPCPVTSAACQTIRSAHRHSTLPHLHLSKSLSAAELLEKSTGKIWRAIGTISNQFTINVRFDYIVGFANCVRLRQAILIVSIHKRLGGRRQLPAFCFKRTMFVWEGEGSKLVRLEEKSAFLDCSVWFCMASWSFWWRRKVEAFMAKLDFVDVFCRADSRSSWSRAIASAVSDAQNEWRKVRSNPAQEEAREKPFWRARDITGLP